VASITETTTLSHGQDKIVWRLDQSGVFTVKSMYAKLSQGASIAHFKDLWAARVPLKIKIFSWQIALDRLPSSLNVAAKRGPGNGRCALCNVEEDVTHIFFVCSPAKLAWSVLRQLLGCSWCPGNFAQFFAIVSSFSGRFKRMIWLLFIAQSWALWLLRNKLTIESRVMNHPADVIFKTMLFYAALATAVKTPGPRLDKENGARAQASSRRKPGA
jgi:hypothetical protein